MTALKVASHIPAMPDVYPLKTYRDLEDESPTEWLIRPLMMLDSQVVMFGPPSEGKSFVALSMALSVATGLPWMGHETKRGVVVYIVAEGGRGVGKRVRAWMKEHGVESVEGAFFLLDAPQLRTPKDLTKLIATLNGCSPVLIVLDTLARTMVGADENSAQDVGEWVHGAQKLQKQTGATVLTLHHTTKRKTKGEYATERGSSALRGAADTMIAISKREDVITICCGKQKDEEPFDQFEVATKVVRVGGTDSIPETSLVLMPLGMVEDKSEPMSAGAELALGVLREVEGPLVSKRAWKHAVDNEHKEVKPERTFMNWVDELIEAGKVERAKKGFYRIKEAGHASAIDVPFGAIGKAA